MKSRDRLSKKNSKQIGSSQTKRNVRTLPRNYKNRVGQRFVHEDGEAFIFKIRDEQGDPPEVVEPETPEEEEVLDEEETQEVEQATPEPEPSSEDEDNAIADEDEDVESNDSNE